MCVHDYEPLMMENLTKIEEWRAAGNNVDYICKQLKIKKGVMYYWMHKSSEVKKAMEYYNTWLLHEEIEPALRKLATGYEKIDQTLRFSSKTKRLEVVEEKRTTVIDAKVTMFLAKALDSETYGDKQQLSVNQLELDESLKAWITPKKEEKDIE